MYGNGQWEDWKMVRGSPFKLTVAKNVDVLVYDTSQCSMKVSDIVNVLSSETEGTKIRFVDEVVEARDENVYSQSQQLCLKIKRER